MRGAKTSVCVTTGSHDEVLARLFGAVPASHDFACGRFSGIGASAEGALYRLFLRLRRIAPVDVGCPRRVRNGQKSTTIVGAGRQ
jgi:hypothetical protein